MSYPPPREVVRDWHPDDKEPLEEWLASWRAKGLEPAPGTPGVAVINGRVTHRYRLRALGDRD